MRAPRTVKYYVIEDSVLAAVFRSAQFLVLVYATYNILVLKSVSVRATLFVSRCARYKPTGEHHALVCQPRVLGACGASGWCTAAVIPQSIVSHACEYKTSHDRCAVLVRAQYYKKYPVGGSANV